VALLLLRQIATLGISLVISSDSLEFPNLEEPVEGLQVVGRSEYGRPAECDCLPQKKPASSKIKKICQPISLTSLRIYDGHKYSVQTRSGAIVNARKPQSIALKLAVYLQKRDYLHAAQVYLVGSDGMERPE